MVEGMEHLRAFREVAQKASFSRSATALGLSKATVSKYIAHLENTLGVRLLNRSTRAVTLTDAGRLLLARSTPLIDMMEETANEVQGHASHPRGVLRVSAPPGLMQTAMPGILAQFMVQYPEVHLSVLITNRTVNLVEEGVDASMCLGCIPDEHIIVRRLRSMELAVCATPAYWARRGMPTTPDDLRRHDVMTFTQDVGTPQIRFQVAGTPYDVPVGSRMDSNDPAPLIGTALAGLGVVCVPSLLVAAQVQRGLLVPVLKDYLPRDQWLYAAYAQRKSNSPALRAMLGFVEQLIDLPGR